MNRERAKWMEQIPHRDLRIVDVSIIAGLQNGTAFFASSTLLAIGGCFAMFSATDEIGKIYSRIGENSITFNALEWELKLLGLAVLFAYTFFKFAWSYRLFNYCSILIGSVPQSSEADSDETRLQIKKATQINVIAARHFNAGQRGIFFAIGYVGWFIGPLWLIFTTTLVTWVLIRRQFYSAARQTFLEGN